MVTLITFHPDSIPFYIICLFSHYEISYTLHHLLAKLSFALKPGNPGYDGFDGLDGRPGGKGERE